MNEIHKAAATLLFEFNNLELLEIIEAVELGVGRPGFTLAVYELARKRLDLVEGRPPNYATPEQYLTPGQDVVE